MRKLIINVMSLKRGEPDMAVQLKVGKKLMDALETSRIGFANRSCQWITAVEVNPGDFGVRCAVSSELMAPTACDWAVVEGVVRPSDKKFDVLRLSFDGYFIRATFFDDNTVLRATFSAKFNDVVGFVNKGVHHA